MSISQEQQRLIEQRMAGVLGTEKVSPAVMKRMVQAYTLGWCEGQKWGVSDGVRIGVWGAAVAKQEKPDA